MSNNSNISPAWAGFRKLWIIVAVILFLLLLLLLLAGYSPWGKKCEVEPTIVEKVVEKEKLVDNPELLARIGVLEKENAMIASLKQENAQIAGLKTNIEELTKSKGLIAGLQAKVKALEAVDINFENPKLISKISLLEKENASIADMTKRIMELEATNAKTNDARNAELNEQIADLKAKNSLIPGLKAKVSALEAIDVNFIKPQDNTKLIQKINGLEVDNLKIPVLQDRVQALQAENNLIPGLKAKVSALEAIDVNYIKPADNTELLTRISDLEKDNALIPGLQAKVKALEAIDVNFIKPADNTELLTRISGLEKENALIPGLKAKVKALEAIDINFIKSGEPKAATGMEKPNSAKLYFEPGSSRFPRDVRQSMADVIVYLRTNTNSTVTLTGFHDATGNTNWNRRLANKRSNRVKQILLDAGIASDRIEIAIPSQTLGTGTPAEARRVEVEISN